LQHPVTRSELHFVEHITGLLRHIQLMHLIRELVPIHLTDKSGRDVLTVFHDFVGAVVLSKHNIVLYLALLNSRN